MEPFLYQKYQEALFAQAKEWVSDESLCRSLPVLSVNRFMEQFGRYYFDTDCYTAIVGCMRELVLEYLEQGILSPELCSDPLKIYKREFSGIIEISQKQLNLILSEFSRKMFDYFTDRYYYLKSDVPYDRKLEKQIASVFQGKGRMKTLYELNNFRPASCSSGAYIYYLKIIHPLFIQQIGGKKAIQVHPDVNEHYLIQRTVNPSRYAVPFIGIMLVGLLVAAFLSLNGLISI